MWSDVWYEHRMGQWWVQGEPHRTSTCGLAVNFFAVHKACRYFVYCTRQTAAASEQLHSGNWPSALLKGTRDCRCWETGINIPLAFLRQTCSSSPYKPASRSRPGSAKCSVACEWLALIMFGVEENSTGEFHSGKHHHARLQWTKLLPWFPLFCSHRVFVVFHFFRFRLQKYADAREAVHAISSEASWYYELPCFCSCIKNY